MVKAYLKSAVAGAFLIGMTTAALAVTGEFNNMCTMGLATGKDIQTDCSISSQVQGKTYCFGSKEAMAEFMKNPTANLAKAQAYYQSKHKLRSSQRKAS
jgi:YHS domain-containing protein